jgi:hypothetical protein
MNSSEILLRGLATKLVPCLLALAVVACGSESPSPTASPRVREANGAMGMTPITSKQGVAPPSGSSDSITVEPSGSRQDTPIQGSGSTLTLATYRKSPTAMVWRTFAGTNLNLNDDGGASFPLPFSIPFAGRTDLTQIHIAMNGVVSFTTNDFRPANQQLPDSSYATLIAPFWDDLYQGDNNQAGNVYWGVLGTTPNREFVVEWRNVKHYVQPPGAQTGTVRFQVVFFENRPDILFNYQDVIFDNVTYDKGAEATVGVQNTTSSANQHSSNTPSLENNTAYLWQWGTVVHTPANGSITNDNTPTYSGTGEPSSTVTVIVDNSPVGTTPADASGNWTLTPATALAEGSHMVRATATDNSGTNAYSNTHTFTVDTVAPATPVVAIPADGSATNDNTPTYSGTAEAGSTVTVIVDGTQVGTTPADGTGTWTFTPAVALTDGPHSVRATATDTVGNTSPTSNTNTFTVDTAPPAAPVVLTPANGSATNDNTPTYSGTAEPGSTVTLIVDGTQVGTTTADGIGTWTFTPAVALTDGPHSVRATATDTVGNTSPDSNTNTFFVDTTPPAAPVVLIPANDSVTDDNMPTYSGTAEAGSTVTVIVDGTQVGTTITTVAGAWTLTPAAVVADGTHLVVATATDTVGNTSPTSNTNTFTVDTAPPPAPVVLTPASGSATNDNTPTYSGTAEPSSTVTLIVDGTQVGTTPTDGAGAWTFTPAAALAEGPHAVEATAMDVAGNTSPVSTTNTFLVDTMAPVAPVVFTPADGSTTNDSVLTYSGAAEAGSTVTVIVDGAQVAPTTANGMGTWTLTPATALAEGPHTVKARAMDAAGNTSPDSNLHTFTINSAPPSVVKVLFPTDGSTINDSNPLIRGLAQPGSAVMIRIDDVFAGMAEFKTPSEWEFHVVHALSPGGHQVKVLASNSIGTPSPDLNINIVIDLTMPDTTIVSGPRALTNSEHATFDVSSNLPGGTYECRLDDGPFAACPDPALFTALTGGDHTLSVRSISAAGNVDSTPAIHHWTVDLKPPEVTISSMTPALTSERSTTFEFSANESPVTFQCSLNGKGFIPCDSPVTFDHLPEGEHQLRVRARDAADNLSEPATYHWQIGPDGDTSGGCDCSALPGSGGHQALVLMLLLGLVARVSRRR